MKIPTFITLEFEKMGELPDRFKNDDVRYSPQLVKYFIDLFTKENDVVFDPFSGYGTTLLVAKEMGRQAYGVEMDEDRYKYLAFDLELNNYIKLGDTAKVDLSNLPGFDLVMASPPYMGKDESADALTGYRYRGNYEGYLQRFIPIYERIKKKLNPGGKIIVEISNLKHQGQVTTLAWDVASTLSTILHFEGEVIICWTRQNQDEFNYGYGYDHSYCLIFSAVAD
ncbi:MAG: DNA methyltransferase [Candidatus Heimdallarchaeota archaeon]|nr:DNA methyltransferase [Candidatus Heimdallarchaeota archaeon]MDH5646028.1 DNA methyltransferase [Candidatus Heimdallarchaeota archaeon]